MIIWFKRNLPEEQRANLKALFDEDTYQMVITPDPTRHDVPGRRHRLERASRSPTAPAGCSAARG